jgi:hypothetical protein
VIDGRDDSHKHAMKHRSAVTVLMQSRGKVASVLDQYPPCSLVQYGRCASTVQLPTMAESAAANSSCCAKAILRC